MRNRGQRLSLLPTRERLLRIQTEQSDVAAQEFVMLILPVCLCLCVAAFSWVDGGSLSRRESLDEFGDIVLSWEVNEFEEEFVVQVEVRTTGVVAVGFLSPRGIVGDFAVGWVANGLPSILDMSLTSDQLTLDEKQDYQLLMGYENETHTILQFKRKFDTCDKLDFKITNDTTRIYYIYQAEDPVNQSSLFGSEAVKGSRSFYLLERRSGRPQMTSRESVWDVRQPNIPLSGNGTLYWCKIFKAPVTNAKRQVIGFEPLIDSHQRTHHVTLYECHGNGAYEGHLADHGHQCYTMSMPKEYTHCSTILIAWGIGSQGDFTPPDVGFPIGQRHGGATYFMLEVHYELQRGQRQFFDNTGLRLFLSDHVRPNDASVINVGHVVSPLQILPPDQKTFVTVAHCGSACTQLLLPITGITVFSIVFQAHSLATGITLRHIRNGTELTPIIREQNYDSTYLQSHQLTRPVKIYPGDHLLLECTYDTTSRNSTVTGGLHLHNEMCLAFIHYFPRTHLTECQSWPAVDVLTSWFNIKLGQQVNGFIVEESQLSSTKTLTEFLEGYQWADRSADYQKDIRFGNYLPFCLKQGRFPADLPVSPVQFPTILHPHYVTSAKCSVNSTRDSPMTSYTKVIDARWNHNAMTSSSSPRTTTVGTTMDDHTDWLGSNGASQWEHATSPMPSITRQKINYVNNDYNYENESVRTLSGAWVVFALIVTSCIC